MVLLLSERRREKEEEEEEEEECEREEADLSTGMHPSPHPTYSAPSEISNPGSC